MTQPTTPNTDDIFRRIVERSGAIDTSALSHGELASAWRNEHITIATAAKICSEIVAEARKDELANTIKLEWNAMNVEIMRRRIAELDAQIAQLNSHKPVKIERK